MNKVYEELFKIQKQLVAKKSEYNSFGKFPYRSAEGILAEVKPLLTNCVVIVNEEIDLIGDRYYLSATATLTDGENSVSAIGHAREPLSQTGMNEGQLSGATSSYAKKYALCNLFAIDGVEKDLDGVDSKEKLPEIVKEKATKDKATERDLLIDKLIKGSFTREDVEKVSVTLFKEKDINKLSKKDFDTLVQRIKAKTETKTETEDKSLAKQFNSIFGDDEEEVKYEDINFESPF